MLSASSTAAAAPSQAPPPPRSGPYQWISRALADALLDFQGPADLAVWVAGNS